DSSTSPRGDALLPGYADALSYPGFLPAYIRPLFSEGRGPFRWFALSGDAGDIRRTDRLVLELFPENRTLARWIRLAGERVPFQGLPAREAWLGYGEPPKSGGRIDGVGARGGLGPPRV